MLLRTKPYQNYFVLFIFLLCGIVIGGFMGVYLEDIPSLSWLNFGITFGMTSPLTLSFVVFEISFALRFNIRMSSIIGILISILLYKKI